MSKSDRKTIELMQKIDTFGVALKDVLGKVSPEEQAKLLLNDFSKEASIKFLDKEIDNLRRLPFTSMSSLMLTDSIEYYQEVKRIIDKELEK